MDNISNNFPKIEELNAANCRACALQNKWPEFYKYLWTTYPKGTMSEKLAMYYQGLTDIPKCVVCGGPVKFVNFRTGWRRTCSYKCQGKDPQVNARRQSTTESHYGVKNPGQAKSVIQKMRQTMKERYGYENPFYNPEQQAKIKKSNIEKYGGASPMCSEDIKKKSRATCKEKYGVEHTGQCKHGVTIFDRYPLLKEVLPNGQWLCRCPHPETCNKCEEKEFVIDANIFYGRVRWNAETCIKLNPFKSQASSQELIIRSWLDEWGIAYITNDRSVIPPKELDIYIPALKIAIECNGCYWHSDMEKPKDYHVKKFKECKDIGIQLIQIWEDWMINKPDIVKSFLQAKLGICNSTIYARKCEVCELDYNVAMEFLEANHIQGKCSSNYRIGLTYESKLVAVMCFNKRSALSGSKQINDSEAELIRFCNLRDTRVVGGASKLLKYYIKKFQPTIVTSYSANDISNGQLYKSLGFVTNGKVNESYWYIEPVTFRRQHRSIYTRSGIVRKWPEYDINDKSWTERIVMDSKGYMRIYDAGTTKWVLNIEQ